MSDSERLSQSAMSRYIEESRRIANVEAERRFGDRTSVVAGNGDDYEVFEDAMKAVSEADLALKRATDILATAEGEITAAAEEQPDA